ncbi:MAG: type II toxin-antitoxin system death-on-curing family toxin [Ferruginibacter sp.]
MRRLSWFREIGGLDSALARPFQTFENNELYPTPVNKSAALIESILVNHPFIDGNKRTDYVLMRIFLITNGLDINATQEEKYDFVINIASGKTKFEEITEWLTNHIYKKNIN